MDSFTLSRNWFNFSFENPELIKPSHSAIYFFAIEHCNRLGNKDKFGLPTTMVMEAIGIKSYNTYIESFNNLVDWGFIKLIEKSKNQYSSNIIALSNNSKAHDKALDKAFIKHASKQSESTGESIDSIIKQETNKQINNSACLFKNSEYSNFDLFKNQFKGTEFEKADLKHYYESFMDWSESKNKKMTNWIATVRGGMRRDKSEGKLKLSPVIKRQETFEEAFSK